MKKIDQKKIHYGSQVTTKLNCNSNDSNSNGSVSKHPQVLWAQDRKYIFVTINIMDPVQVQLGKTADQLTFEAESNGESFGFELDLFKSVKPDSWAESVSQRQITLLAEKENTNEPFWTRLYKQSDKRTWIKTDFSKFVEDTFDEPDADEQPFGGAGLNEEMLKMMAQGAGDQQMNFNIDEVDSDDEPPKDE